jgi:hypothetical protein
MTLPKGSVIRDCGPEALAAVFYYHRRKVSVDEIANHIYSAQLKGTPVAKVLTYCREMGFRTVVKKGTIADIRATIQENRPVLVMGRFNANLAHLFVVAGYNDSARRIVCPYYNDKILLIEYGDFNLKWTDADNFFLDLIPIDDPFDRAEQLEHGKNYREALGFYEQAAKANPDNYRAFVGIGNCRAMIGEIAPARDAYEKAYALNPNDPQLMNNLADCLSTLNQDLPRATELASKAVEMYRSDVAGLQKIVHEARDEADRAEREAQLEQEARRLCFAYGTLGQALLKQKRWDQSLEALEHSFDLIPAGVNYRQLRIRRLGEMAECHRQLGHTAQADDLQKRADLMKAGN